MFLLLMPYTRSTEAGMSRHERKREIALWTQFSGVSPAAIADMPDAEFKQRVGAALKPAKSWFGRWKGP